MFVSSAYFLSKYGLGVTFRRIESMYFNGNQLIFFVRISRPKLVRETSRGFMGSFRRYVTQDKEKIFNKIVLNDELRH